MKSLKHYKITPNNILEGRLWLCYAYAKNIEVPVAQYPKPITKLIEHLKQLPGVGQKTAERYAFSILGWEKERQDNLGEQLQRLSLDIVRCETCGSYCEGLSCQYCDSTVRDGTTLLVVAYPKETYALEELGGFRGKFHVLGGLLSPLDGIEPDDLSFAKLQERVEETGVTEIILALDTTIEGDATALYLKELFRELPVTLSRLAHGMPIGSSLEYIDQHTLLQAFAGRRDLS